MAEPTDKEHRGPVNLRIKFRSASLQQFIERYGVDVSRGGIFIRTREPLPVGTRLKLDFQLVDAAPLFQGDGTVVWIREYDPGKTGVTPGMGVRFDRLTPESQPTLDKILDEKMRLQQTGVAPGGAATAGAGLAVRRPSGVITALDARAPGAAATAAAAVEVKMDAPAVGAAPVTTMPARSRARAPCPTRRPARPRPAGGERRVQPATDDQRHAPRDRARRGSRCSRHRRRLTSTRRCRRWRKRGRRRRCRSPRRRRRYRRALVQHGRRRADEGVRRCGARIRGARGDHRSSDLFSDLGVPVAAEGDISPQRGVEPSEPVPAVGQSAPGKDAPMMGSLDAPLAAHLDGTAPAASRVAGGEKPASAAPQPQRRPRSQSESSSIGRAATESGRFRSDASTGVSRKGGDVVARAGRRAAAAARVRQAHATIAAAAVAAAPAARRDGGPSCAATACARQRGRRWTRR